MNTGYQQSTIACCVSKVNNKPLDIDGRFCEETGNKQAVLLLEGYTNPKPEEYEVAGYFRRGEWLDDLPTRRLNADACPIEEPEPTLPEYKKYPLEYRVFQNQSVNGFYPLVIGRDWDNGQSTDEYNTNKGTYPVRRVGEYEWLLSNWKMEYQDNQRLSTYKLTQTVLDTDNIPATVQEINIREGNYNYADSDADKVTASLLHKIHSWNIYPYEETTDNLITKAGKRNININSETKKYENDIGSFGYSFVKPNTEPIVTISANKELAISYSHGWADAIDGNDIVEVDGTAIKLIKETEGSRYQYQFTFGSSYPFYYFVNFSVSSFEELDEAEVKIEFGNNPRTQYSRNKQEWLDENYYDGWKIPDVKDFAQLFAMSGELDPSNIIKHVFSSPAGEVPYAGYNIGEDILGTRITASGQRQNVENGLFYSTYGNSAYFATHYDPFTSSALTAPTIRILQTSSQVNGEGIQARIIADDSINVAPPYSTRFWLRSVRFCRQLTDEELGYKLYKNEAEDTITVVQHSAENPAVKPQGTTELPKGILRGLAVRWMNEDKTKVLAPLSILEAEAEKTRNGGEYGWYGFFE